MKKVLVTIVMMLVVIFVISNVVFADSITNAMAGYENMGGNDAIGTIGGNILSVVQAIAISAAVIMIVVIGIKFMLAAPSEKAEVKKQLTPYIIGCVILFGTTTFLQIAKVVGDIIVQESTKVL